MSRLQRSLWIAAAVAAVALSARLAVPVPGSGVPQSAQTLAVLVVGALLGTVDGAAALTAYVIVGGLGVPVFSDGASGWAHVVGPTGGYLLGFVAAAAAVGWCANRGVLRRVGAAFAVMLAAHILILSCGWSGLALTVGPAAAFQEGVAPFLIGGIVKSVIAAAIILAVARRREPVSRSRDDTPSLPRVPKASYGAAVPRAKLTPALRANTSVPSTSPKPVR